jgi:hypothetical protein
MQASMPVHTNTRGLSDSPSTATGFIEWLSSTRKEAYGTRGYLGAGVNTGTVYNDMNGTVHVPQTTPIKSKFEQQVESEAYRRTLPLTTLLGDATTKRDTFRQDAEKLREDLLKKSSEYLKNMSMLKQKHLAEKLKLRTSFTVSKSEEMKVQQGLRDDIERIKRDYDEELDLKDGVHAHEILLNKGEIEAHDKRATELQQNLEQHTKIAKERLTKLQKKYEDASNALQNADELIKSEKAKHEAAIDAERLAVQRIVGVVDAKVKKNEDEKVKFQANANRIITHTQAKMQLLENALESERIKHRAKLEADEKQFLNLTTEHRNLVTNHAILRTQLADKTREITELTIQKDELQMQAANNAQDVSDDRQNTLQVELSRIQSNIIVAEEQLAETQRLSHRIHDNMDEKREELKAIESSITSSIQERVMAEGRLATGKAKLIELSTKIQKKTRELNRVRSSINNAKLQHDIFRDAVTSMEILNKLNTFMNTSKSDVTIKPNGILSLAGKESAEQAKLQTYVDPNVTLELDQYIQGLHTQTDRKHTGKRLKRV